MSVLFHCVLYVCRCVSSCSARATLRPEQTSVREIGNLPNAWRQPQKVTLKQDSAFNAAINCRLFSSPQTPPTVRGWSGRGRERSIAIGKKKAANELTGPSFIPIKWFALPSSPPSAFICSRHSRINRRRLGGGCWRNGIFQNHRLFILSALSIFLKREIFSVTSDGQNTFEKYFENTK